MKLKIFLVALLGISSIVFWACNKEAAQSELKVHMTDAPAAWDEVNIDLQEVQVKLGKDSSKWLTLQTNTGIYNLLGFQNGLDTVIAQGSFPTGEMVKEIRLIVGSDNSIVVSGQSYPLTIPSGAETGLKIKVHKPLQASLENILIDFDAELSIKEENGGYKLLPVIQLK
ncbi:MAG TPA: DUF4382 domain-containing protein [Chitinophagaceae bacterium]|nr:DUF4382 domain-containing protein [Chitinophagaceae bacterium]